MLKVEIKEELKIFKKAIQDLRKEEEQAIWDLQEEYRDKRVGLNANIERLQRKCSHDFSSWTGGRISTRDCLVCGYTEVDRD